jgi:hypothetical protein
MIATPTLRHARPTRAGIVGRDMGDKELSDRRPLAGVPAPQDGVVGTTLLIVTDQDRSREFYVDVLAASAIRERDPVVLRLGGMWLILNDGGGPTPDKPETIAAPPPTARASAPH